MSEQKVLDLLLDPEVQGTNEQREAMSKYNLSKDDMEVYQISKEMLAKDPNDKLAIDAKNKIYNKMMLSAPSKNVQGVGIVDRFKVKNLISDDIDYQKKYFEKKGYQTRIKNDELEVKKPEDSYFSKIDPEGLDLMDVSDVLTDVLEGIFVGAAGTAGAAASLPSTLGIGAVPAAAGAGMAAAGASEYLRQSTAKYLGLRDQLNPARIVTNAGIEGLASIALPGISKYVSNTAKKSFGVLKDVSGGMVETAKEITDKIKKSGLEPLVAQLTTSDAYREKFRRLIDMHPNMFNSKLKEQISKGYETIKNETAAMIKPFLDKEPDKYGSEIREAIEDDFAQILAPASALYENSEKSLIDAYKSIPKQYASDHAQGVSEIIKKNAVDPVIEIINKGRPIVENDNRFLNFLKETVSGIDSFQKLKETKTSLSNVLKNMSFYTPNMENTGYKVLTALQDAQKSIYHESSIFTDRLNKSSFYDDFVEKLTPYVDGPFGKEAKKIIKNINKAKKNLLDPEYQIDAISDDIIYPIKNVIEFLQSKAPQIKDNKNLSILNKEIKSFSNLYDRALTSSESALLTMKSMDDLLEANRMWTEGYDLVKALTTKSGQADIKGTAKEAMERFLNRTADKEFVKKVLDFGEATKVANIKRLAPRAFEALRQAEINKIFSGINLDVQKDYIQTLRSKLKKIMTEPGKVKLLFGDDGYEKLVGFQTWMDTMPKIDNPQTAKAMMEYLFDYKTLIPEVVQGVRKRAMGKVLASELNAIEKVSRDPNYIPKSVKYAEAIDKFFQSTKGRMVGPLLVPTPSMNSNNEGDNFSLLPRPDVAPPNFAKEVGQFIDDITFTDTIGNEDGTPYKRSYEAMPAPPLFNKSLSTLAEKVTGEKGLQKAFKILSDKVSSGEKLSDEASKLYIKLKSHLGGGLLPIEGGGTGANSDDYINFMRQEKRSEFKDTPFPETIQAHRELFDERHPNFKDHGILGKEEPIKTKQSNKNEVDKLIEDYKNITGKEISISGIKKKSQIEYLKRNIFNEKERKILSDLDKKYPNFKNLDYLKRISIADEILDTGKISDESLKIIEDANVIKFKPKSDNVSPKDRPIKKDPNGGIDTSSYNRKEGKTYSYDYEKENRNKKVKNSGKSMAGDPDAFVGIDEDEIPKFKSSDDIHNEKANEKFIKESKKERAEYLLKGGKKITIEDIKAEKIFNSLKKDTYLNNPIDPKMSDVNDALKKLFDRGYDVMFADDYERYVKRQLERKKTPLKFDEYMFESFYKKVRNYVGNKQS